jgi:hypothetical protein
MRKILFGAVVMMGLAAGTAQATSDSFVWKDAVNGFTFSFPDSWGIQTVDAPTTRVRIAGPLSQDYATCRVKAEEDGRLKIYPKHLMEEAVYETLDRSFWEREIQDHNNANITDIRGPASLGGKGDATAIKETFVLDTGKGKINMYGESIASIYADKRFVVSCSSKLEEFKKYAPVFATIIGSVDLDTRYHPFATGYYRDFLADPVLTLPRSQPGTIHQKNAIPLSKMPHDW